MAKTVRKLEQKTPVQPRLTRVAAYARVSSGKDTMLHSLSAQVSAYSEMIQSHPGWLYYGVYSDEAVTGTKEVRENFQRLLEDCRSGKVDMIITKSISRFARNTVTLLETVRELKGLGVDVFFEEQNIHTLSGEGELMLTILAGFAEEESLSVSENMKWRIRKNFEEGMPWDGTLLGYRYKDGRYVIQPDEAETVRFIFREYLGGKGVVAISNELNEMGKATRIGEVWHISTVQRILRNYTYTGNLLLQKTYRENHITKRTVKNQGQLPKYHAEQTHEAIISIEDFEKVQVEIERRAEKYAPSKRDSTKHYPFTGIVICGNCGKAYRRKTTRGGITWCCPTYNFKGKAACASKMIPENTLIKMTEEVIGSVDALHDEITVIRAENGNRLVFIFKDGTEIVKEWKDRSRAESWTPEMKEKARQKTKEQHRHE